MLFRSMDSSVSTVTMLRVGASGVLRIEGSYCLSSSPVLSCFDCILPAHSSVCTANTQFGVYCQHTVQCTLTLSVRNVTDICIVTSQTNKNTRSVRHSLPVLSAQNMTFIFLPRPPSLSPPSLRDVQPWTETACSHLVYRYTANRYQLSVTATGCVLQRPGTCSSGCRT